MNSSWYYRILSVILLVLFFSTSQAQDLRPRAVEAGFCAGPTIGWVAPQTESYESTGVKLGAYYGLLADINLIRTKEVLFLSTGIVFKHIRFGLNYTDNYHLVKKDEKIDNARITSAYNPVFLTIPTAVKLKTDPFSNFAIFGIAGLEHGFRLAAKSNDEVTRPDNTRDKANKVNQTKNIVLLKESIFATLGVEYTFLKHTKASFAIGYNYGLNSIFNRKYKNAISKEKVVAHIHTVEFQFRFIF